MILIFDLDDTLYNEQTYVKSGLWAVAKYGEVKFGWESESSFRFMHNVLECEGRGRVFDLWLADKGKVSRNLIGECLRVYRHHTPSLYLVPEVQKLLPQLASEYPLYLVTDGHKIVQKNKIESLGISRFFRQVMITHRYGIRHAKPSTYCFELIRKKEKCEWSDMVYVGDNPGKDFVNLNPLGVTTIRVKTGMYRNVIARSGYDAKISIDNLKFLPEVLGVRLE